MLRTNKNTGFLIYIHIEYRKIALKTTKISEHSTIERIKTLLIRRKSAKLSAEYRLMMPTISRATAKQGSMRARTKHQIECPALLIDDMRFKPAK